MYSDEDGRLAVRFARAVIEGLLTGKEVERPELPEVFDQLSGAFVTINKFKTGALRGCIGYIEPIRILRNTLEEVAVSAAVRDPRFPRVKAHEIDRILVEVSLLTPLEIIPAGGEDVVPHVKVGRDGLVMERHFSRGVLLPQVPVEYKWDAVTFLEHTAVKAGLPSDAWKDDATKIWKFSAEVFEEKTPRGEIVRKPLDGPAGESPDE